MAKCLGVFGFFFCLFYPVGYIVLFNKDKPRIAFLFCVDICNIWKSSFFVLGEDGSLITDIFLICILAQGYLFMVSEEKMCTVNSKIK